MRADSSWALGDWSERDAGSASDTSSDRCHEVLERLLASDWPDRGLCLQVCGMTLMLAQLDPLPDDVSNDVHAVRRHLLHCACTGEGPDWVALARRLRRSLARCGLAPQGQGAPA